MSASLSRPTTSARPSASPTRSAPRPSSAPAQLCRPSARALAGHVMVSRQETARPLLTPGEVMQLPRPTSSCWSPACRRSAPRSCAITRTATSPRVLPPPALGERRAMPIGRRPARRLGRPGARHRCAPRRRTSQSMDQRRRRPQQERHPGDEHDITRPHRRALSQEDDGDDIAGETRCHAGARPPPFAHAINEGAAVRTTTTFCRSSDHVQRKSAINLLSGRRPDPQARRPWRPSRASQVGMISAALPS